MYAKVLVLLFCAVTTLTANREPLNDANRIDYKPSILENSAEYWNANAAKTVDEKLSQTLVKGIAKNVVIVLANGLSKSTLTASRILKGQREQKPGEETKLAIESLPFSGLAKTYCVNKQVPDGACSATAIFTGIKANSDTLGVAGIVEKNDCVAASLPANQVTSVLRWAQNHDKRTGFVTNGRVTQASVAATYAVSPNHRFESDTFIRLIVGKQKKCVDIAHQLVRSETGKKLNVILGGGKGNFLPIWKQDEDGNRGWRSDGHDLIQEWKDSKKNQAYKYVWDLKGLLTGPKRVDYLLGLFATNKLPYNLDRDVEKIPSLVELVQSSLPVLNQGNKGYVLVVDAANVDRANHANRAQKALDEAIEVDKVVEHLLAETKEEETLIVVATNHGHTLSITGYPNRGHDILGLAGVGSDGLPYSTLSYANGPGYRLPQNGKRHDISNDDLSNKNYQFPAAIPLIRATNEGSDAGVYARGPWAHLFTGVYEQNEIAHAVGYAACIAEGPTVCGRP